MPEKRSVVNAGDARTRPQKLSLLQIPTGMAGRLLHALVVLLATLRLAVTAGAAYRLVERPTREAAGETVVSTTRLRRVARIPRASPSPRSPHTNRECP